MFTYCIKYHKLVHIHGSTTRVVRRCITLFLHFKLGDVFVFVLISSNVPKLVIRTQNFSWKPQNKHKWIKRIKIFKRRIVEKRTNSRCWKIANQERPVPFWANQKRLWDWRHSCNSLRIFLPSTSVWGIVGDIWFVLRELLSKFASSTGQNMKRRVGKPTPNQTEVCICISCFVLNFCWFICGETRLVSVKSCRSFRLFGQRAWCWIFRYFDVRFFDLIVVRYVLRSLA